MLRPAGLGSFLRCHSTGLPGEHPVELVARVLADKLSTSLKQPFIVENKAGASQVVGSDDWWRADLRTLAEGLMKPAAAPTAEPAGRRR